MKNILVRSDIKTFYVNPKTGANGGLTRYGNHVITAFNLDAFKAEWGDPAPEVIDIIDLGYWYYLASDKAKVIQYEPPVWHRTRSGHLSIQAAA